MDPDVGIPEYVISAIVERALDEDIGVGDITSRSTLDWGMSCKGAIIAKEQGIVAGICVAEATFRRVDAQTMFTFTAHDGKWVTPGTTVLRIDGEAQAILAAERTALNFMQRMSGIATLTALYVEAVKGTWTRICDTRKTAPGLRVLDKYAVRAGGGHNHRMGLFDGVLIKDNHIRAAGGIGEAISRARKGTHHLLKIEVEAQSLAEVAEALEAGADVILLDNMELDEISGAVKLVAGRCETEVSGGVSLDTVRALAETGVDYISVGRLTHSAPALDLSLEIVDD